MDFLKKNYEKVILIGLFLVFILVLLQLINIINESKQTTVDDLKLPVAQEADFYVIADSKSDDFNLPKFINHSNSWVKNNKNDKTSSDFTQSFEIVKCAHCGKFIPMEVLLNGGACPICFKTLVKFVPKAANAKNSGGTDTDDDGIPDLIESKLGLNPYNPLDGITDLDSDGFSNVFEYMHKTEIDNAESHPPYYYGFRVESIERQILDMTLKGVEVFGDDKNNWTVQIETGAYIYGRRKYEAKNQFKYIGDSFPFAGNVYTVKSIDSKDINTTIDNKPAVKKEFTVIITDKQGREISVVSDQVVYSPDDKITFTSVIPGILKNDTISGIVGGTIVVGSKDSGFEKYKITAMTNKGKLTATLDFNGKTFVVNTKAGIPDEYRAIVIETKDDSEMGNGDMPPRNAPQRRRR